MSSRKTVQIAAKLYEARDSLKRLLGETFEAKMEPYKRAVQSVADRKYSGDALRACQAMLETMQRDGVDGFVQLAVLAATVELIEPSVPGEKSP